MRRQRFPDRGWCFEAARRREDRAGHSPFAQALTKAVQAAFAPVGRLGDADERKAPVAAFEEILGGRLPHVLLVATHEGHAVRRHLRPSGRKGRIQQDRWDMHPNQTVRLLACTNQGNDARAAPALSLADALLVMVARLEMELPRTALAAVFKDALENLPMQKLVRREYDEDLLFHGPRLYHTPPLA